MRDGLVRIRVTQNELQALREAAIARRVTLSELMRRSALGIRLPQAKFSRRDIDLLVKLLGELGRIGSNLNQLTRQINRGRAPAADALPALLSNLETTRSEIRELLK
jgi:hypothetical protein